MYVRGYLQGSENGRVVTIADSVVWRRRGIGVALPATTASNLFVFKIVFHLPLCTRFTLFGGNMFAMV